MNSGAVESLVKDWNSLALEALAKGNFKTCENLLEKAESLLIKVEVFKGKEKLEALTQLNLGIYFKTADKTTSALKSFEKVLLLSPDQHLETEQILNLYISLCSLYIKNGQIHNLFIHADAALKLINKQKINNDGLLATLYYYLGFGYEKIDDILLAEKNYKLGMQVGHKSLGFTHPTIVMIMKRYVKLAKSEKNNKDEADKKTFEREKTRHQSQLSQKDKNSLNFNNKNKLKSESSKKSIDLPKISTSRHKVNTSLDFMNKTKIFESNPEKLSTPKHSIFFEEAETWSSKKVKPPLSRKAQTRRLSTDLP